jgi:ABC-type Fe3+/spermidine/putrescine transport system ATPase subunit
MVFQQPLLFSGLTVSENVAFGLRMRRLPRAEIARRVAAMLALVQLSDLGPRLPAALSGGQAQRVALARALVVEPRLLLLDEPLTALDAHLRAKMRALIRDVQRRLGITTLLVTHDQEEAAALADRMGLMLGGRLRQAGPPEALYQRPADPEVARFFGGRNLWPGLAAGGRFLGPPGPLHLPDGAPEGPGHLTIRPEAVRLGPAGVNALPARVAERQFLGPRTRLRLLAGEVEVEADLPPDQARDLPPGSETTIHLPPGNLWMIPAGEDTGRRPAG